MKIFLLLLLSVFHISNSLNAQGPVYRVWNTSNSSIPSNSLYSIYIDNDGIIWIGSTNNGLIKFDGVNFTTFNMSNSPMKGNYASSITSDKFNNLWITAIHPGAGNQGALMKFDRVNNWSFYNTTNSGISNGNNMKVAIDSNNTVWVCWFKLSKFNGTTWVTYDSTNSPIKFSALREIYVDKFNNKWVGVDGYGLYKLTNDTNWTYYNPLNSGFGGTNVNKIKEDDSGNLWITVGFHGLSKYNPSSNQWQNWTPENSGLITGHPWGLWVDKENVKWIGYGYGGSLTSLQDTTFTFYPPAMQIYEMAKDNFGNLWMATAEGLLEFNKNGIVGVYNQSSIVPNSFNIKSIYPNPFNPITNIKFSINKKANLVINIYSIKGEKLETLTNKNYAEGEYELSWNAQNFASGIYFVSFYINNNFIEGRRITLVK